MINEIEARKKLDKIYELLSLYKKNTLNLLSFIKFIELIRYFLGSNNKLELYANSILEIKNDSNLFEFVEINTNELLRSIIIGTVKDCNDTFNQQYLLNKIK